MGKHEEALRDYDARIERYPGDSYAHKRRAASYFYLNRYEEALADLAKSLELTPKDASALFWIPPALVAKCPDTSFIAGLLALAETAVKNSPDPENARSARVALYLGVSEFGKARADLAERLELDDQRFSDHYQHALLCLAENDLADYRESCQAMLRILADTEDPDSAHFTAWTCALAPSTLEKYDEPIAMATRALAADPQSEGYQNTLGAVLYRAGRHEEALRQLTELSKRRDNLGRDSESSPAYTWYFLAMAHHTVGDAEQAQEYLTKANQWTDEVLADEESPPAWNRRATLELLRNEAETLLKTEDQKPTEDDQELEPKTNGQVESGQEPN